MICDYLVLCVKDGRLARLEEARCMTDMIVICSECRRDAWHPDFEHLHPRIHLPNGVTLFDIHIAPSGSVQFYIDLGHNRTTLVVEPGDDPVGRFHKLLGETMKERGIPKDASKKIKKMDESYDKKHGLKEGGKADLKADKSLLKREGYKKGGK
jgi:hypothetical protein